MKNFHPLLILLGSVVLILVSVALFQQISYQNQVNTTYLVEKEKEDQKGIVRENITKYVIAERSAYQYSKLGGIYGLKISVTNNSDYLIDNVKVKVTYIKANGDIWKEKIIDFNLLDPHHVATQAVSDEERGVKIEYEIVAIKSNVLGI